MKKIVMTAALVACAAVVTAETVTSANIVGYGKTTKKGASQLQLLGISFGQDQTLSELMSTDQFTGGFLPFLADQVITYDADNTTYVTYGLHTSGEWRDVNAFTVVGNLDPVLPAGTAVFLKTPSASADSEVIFAGEAPLEQFATNSIAAGLQLISLPFSCSITLGVAEGTAFADSGATAGFLPFLADQISAWDDVNQTYVTYGLHTSGEWRDVNTFTVAGQTPTINLGEGFWYNANSGFSWVQENPYFNNL